MSPPDGKSGPAVPRRLRLSGIGFLVVVALIVTYGLVSRAAQSSRLQELTQEEAVPTVAIIAPQPAGNSPSLDLPGRLEAYISAPIYARVPGYLKS